MASSRQWNKLTNAEFKKWIDEQNIKWVVVTFKCRISPIRLKNSDAEKIHAKEISFDSVSKGCSINDIEKGFSETVKHLDRHFLKTSQRKVGLKLHRVPFIGGDPKSGVWNHIHALIELPESTSIEFFRDYINKIFPSKMKYIYRGLKNRNIEAEVWCNHYVPQENKFIEYCLRQEDESTSVKFDKVIISQLVLSPVIGNIVSH